MNQPNPAWKSLLDKLPPALHPMVMPVLEEWDKGVQDQFTKIREEYKPYEAFKPFIENNIAPDYAWQSVVFADELQQDPAKVVDQVTKAFELEYVSKADHEKALAEAQANVSNNDDGDLFDTEDGTKVDLSKIPEFAQVKQTLEQMQQQSEAERKREEEQAALDEFNSELDALEEKVTADSKPFNRKIITAFMASGLSGEDAVKEFHLLLGQGAETDDTSTDSGTDAPITMGNGGNAGSGTPEQPIKWADMPNSDFNANVAKILEAQLGQNS